MPLQARRPPPLGRGVTLGVRVGATDRSSGDRDHPPSRRQPAHQPTSQPTNELYIPEGRVAKRLENLLVDREAKHRLAMLSWREPPPPLTLTDDLTTLPPKKRDLVDGLLAVDSNVLLTAERKTGKTILLLNLAGALLSGRAFLGRTSRLPTNATVVFLNLEVSRGQFARWAARAVQSDDHSRFVSRPLRGSSLPLTDDQVRGRFAEQIRPFQPAVLIVDPWGALIAGWAAENSNDQVASALLALDQFKVEIGASGLLLATHTGKGLGGGGRARGATRLEDWPDALWYLTEGDGDDRHRYLRAEGRDVDVREHQLEFDPISGWPTPTGEGGKGDAQSDELEAKIVALIAEESGMYRTSITAGVGGRRRNAEKALDRLVEQRQVLVAKNGTTRRYYLPSVPPE